MIAKISVIITSHNSDNLLFGTLDSVHNQTLTADEIILVDDDSRTPTEKLLESYPHKQRRFRAVLGSLGAALNFGISKATHDLIAPLDHDDYWPLDKLEWQSKLLYESNADVVVGSVVNEWHYPNGEISSEFMGIARVLGSCLIHRRAFDLVGPLEEGAEIHEIIEWWSRAGTRLRVVSDPRVTLHRRIHGKNQTIVFKGDSKSDLLARVRRHIKGHPSDAG